MNQRDGFYRIDTERMDARRNVNPYRITDAIIAAICMAVVVAVLGGWL